MFFSLVNTFETGGTFPSLIEKLMVFVQVFFLSPFSKLRVQPCQIGLED